MLIDSVQLLCPGNLGSDALRFPSGVLKGVAAVILARVSFAVIFWLLLYRLPAAVTRPCVCVACATCCIVFVSVLFSVLLFSRVSLLFEPVSMENDYCYIVHKAGGTNIRTAKGLVPKF